MFSTSWKDEHRPPSLSSSPDHYASDRILSSPSPSSPIYSFPRIHSGPNSPSFPQDDYHLSWDPPTDPKATYSLPSFRSLFPSDDEHPLTSEYDASEFSEPDAAQDDSFLTESEDEEHDPFFSDSRVTFTVSAERGRWKSDPLPRHALLRIAARTTSPAPSPVPSVVQRNISEPAPSTTKTLPIEDSPERQTSPPLPEHTSPVLSPISLSVSPMVGSVSPLSVLEPLSPLSLPPSSLAGDHEMDMDLESFPDNDEILTPMESETGLGLFVRTIAADWALIRLMLYAGRTPCPSRYTPIIAFVLQCRNRRTSSLSRSDRDDITRKGGGTCGSRFCEGRRSGGS